jgi:hypothetical protein
VSFHLSLKRPRQAKRLPNTNRRDQNTSENPHSIQLLGNTRKVFIFGIGLKIPWGKSSCGFDSRLRHQENQRVGPLGLALFFWGMNRLQIRQVIWSCDWAELGEERKCDGREAGRPSIQRPRNAPGNSCWRAENFQRRPPQVEPADRGALQSARR